ncbi:ribonuclease VapC [Salinarimonas ramus]|uniref:Ribonuclease VapC n=1 Tax=Salinarimonas ramus TaxID=690164 RepID=A0A917V2N7_9HYPH|nr:ribonuclease VapC [Salinarimonas ramus]
MGEHAVLTSPFVACELRYGAIKKDSSRLAAAVDALLQRLVVADIDTNALVHTYARARADLERAGEPIGAMDLLIACHALSLGCVVVTRNRREFSRVHGLAVENWLD